MKQVLYANCFSGPNRTLIVVLADEPSHKQKIQQYCLAVIFQVYYAVRPYSAPRASARFKVLRIYVDFRVGTKVNCL